MKEMKWKKNKGKKWIGAFCLLMTFIIWQVICPAYIFAQVKESEIESEELKQTVIEDKEEEKSVRFPNKLEAKEPPNSNQEADNVNKGIPSVASSSKAQLVENVNNANQDYPIHHGESTGEENDKYSADARQFITFKTKNGKTFHLIINHDEEGENVMLLTEVSEDDLLNMVEIKEKPKEAKKIEEMPPQAEVKKEEPVKEAPKKEEKSGAGLYLLLGLIIISVVGVGYYFKIYKKKQEESEDDEDYDELVDDYENEDKDKDLGENDNKEIDDMAVDAYNEEDD